MSAEFAIDLLQHTEKVAAGTNIRSFRMNASDDWLLGEHRLAGGNALIPGTGYIDLLFSTLSGDTDSIELQDLAFSSPFVVPDDLEREIFLSIDGDTQISSEFIFYSEDTGQRIEHATGKIRQLEKPPRQSEDLAQIRSQFSGKSQLP